MPRKSELLAIFRAGRITPLAERSFAKGSGDIPQSVPGVLPSVSDSLAAQRLVRRDAEEQDDARIPGMSELGGRRRSKAVARVLHKRENEVRGQRIQSPGRFYRGTD